MAEREGQHKYHATKEEEKPGFVPAAERTSGWQARNVMVAHTEAHGRGVGRFEERSAPNHRPRSEEGGPHTQNLGDGGGGGGDGGVGCGHAARRKVSEGIAIEGVEEGT